MGIFSTADYVCHGSQKISERFLKKMGFHKDYWGSPHENYKKPGSVFWEKYIFNDEDLKDDNEIVCATIWYFPETFTGYVTSYNMSGYNPSTGIFGQVNDNSNWSYRGYTKCKMDVLYVMDLMTEEIKQQNSK